VIKAGARCSVVAGALAAGPADAHLVETGFGAFYDGVAHLVVTPSDLLLVIALALLAGQRGQQTARWTLLVLPIAWLVGGVIGTTFPTAVALPVLTTLSFGVAGALVALDARLGAGAIALFATVAGLLHGYVNGATLAPDAGTLALAGAVSSVFCVFAILAAQVTTIHVAWGRVALRAGGSWIAAAGLLMLGWLARGG
jgi:hydrogenase/urease accessory protein HupE